jgi:predicted DCC family thiol-disulfide oxidoreductase YuxK
MESYSLILFDGVCGLCNKWVDFVLRHDHVGQYKFAALQSPAGQEILAQRGLPSDYQDSILLIERGVLHKNSTAALRIFRGLGGVWGPLYWASAVPATLRDRVYYWVAKHRYSVFGKQSECRLPSSSERERFL